MSTSSNQLKDHIRSFLDLVSDASIGRGKGCDDLDSLLSCLVSASSSLINVAELDHKDGMIIDFLNRCTLIVECAETKPFTRSKVLLIFSNLFYYNLSMRRIVSNSKSICRSIFNCLEQGLQVQIGPQNTIDILRLIQLLTYEKVQYDNWIDELIVFIRTQIMNSNANSSELLPYCACILANLISQSKNLTNKLRQTDSFKSLCNQVLRLLSHDSKAVVIAALTLVGYLDHETRDTVYNSHNINQTFFSVFNILGASSNAFMVTQLATDLLRKMIIIKDGNAYSLNQLAQNVLISDFYEESIRKIANLLTLFEPRLEESMKIVELLKDLCSIDELRSRTAMAIVAIEPSEVKIVTPCQILLRTAMLTLDLFNLENPINAQRLLIILINEAIESGKNIRQLFVCTGQFHTLIRRSMETEIDSIISGGHDHLHAVRLAECLRLAEALSNDEELRLELVAELDARLFSSVFDHHLADSIQISDFISRQQFEEDNINGLFLSWSIDTAAIPIQLMKLLTSLKDFSKPHKDLYWRFLKDLRLLPFIAYALACGDHDLVFDALFLLKHCSQVYEFPLKTLSGLTVKCSILRNTKPTVKVKKICDNNYPFISLLDCNGGMQKRRADDEFLKEKKLMEEELNKERAMHVVMRQKFDEMTRKFDDAAELVFEKQMELEKHSQSHEVLKLKIEKLEQEVTKKSTALEATKKEIMDQRKVLSRNAQKMEELTRENEFLLDLKKKMSALLNDFGNQK